ncbi:MAG: hypothetical protein J6M05_05720 [Cardiobacteriaceae bacterium]|nr:hypothetical protein [Cardiobacteriaceae bacterium]
MNKNNEICHCQICGLIYEEIDLGEICVCCGAEFGYDDEEGACGKTIDVYRQKWFDTGAALHYAKSELIPQNWSLNTLKIQLANIGFNLTDEMIAEIEKNSRKR